MIGKDEATAGRHAKRTTYVSDATWKKFGEFKAGIIGRKGESAVARMLSDLDVAALNDVLLPDAQGVTQVDHLVLVRGAVLVIETKTYGGLITGSVGAAEWVQHLNNGETRYAFQNPVHQNGRHCRAVEAVLAGLDVPITGIIVSAGSATFCDELRGSVVPLSLFADRLHSTQGSERDPPQLELAWRRLCRAVTEAEPRREEHRDAILQRRIGSYGGAE